MQAPGAAADHPQPLHTAEPMRDRGGAGQTDQVPDLPQPWNEDCTNAWKLWEEIVPLGYRGTYGRVSAYLRDKRSRQHPAW